MGARPAHGASLTLRSGGALARAPRPPSTARQDRIRKPRARLGAAWQRTDGVRGRQIGKPAQVLQVRSDRRGVGIRDVDLRTRELACASRLAGRNATAPGPHAVELASNQERCKRRP